MFGFSKKRLSTEELDALIKNKEAILIDVRETYEYASGHIPGSVNIPLSLLPVRIQDVADTRSQRLVVQCLSGGRSAQAKMWLESQGYQSVDDFGGIGRYDGNLV
ncbi:MAG: rhodanese-like domain-containing protein [Erysipelotrichaceae bacterium]